VGVCQEGSVLKYTFSIILSTFWRSVIWMSASAHFLVGVGRQYCRRSRKKQGDQNAPSKQK
jgi:hypothetical protein